MVRKRYILLRVLPPMIIFLIGMLCLKNLYLGYNKSYEDKLDSDFVPQKPQVKAFDSNANVQNEMMADEKEKLQELMNSGKHLQNLDMIKESNLPKTTSSTNKQCPNQKCNFLFIKTMKCATETVVRILRKYSYDNNLNIMLPQKKRLYLAWPYLMDDLDYRLSDRPFNGLIDHAIYNKTIMNRYFPPETTHYVTIIREPLKHFKSAFSYFKIQQIAGIFAKHPLTEYLENIKYYDSIYKSHEAAHYRYCIPDGFSVTKNLIAHCLGMPLGFPYGRQDITNNSLAVREYIRNLDREFSLVMIVEYFHESLVLFKRLMKWQLKDLIYKFVNRGTYYFSLSNRYKEKHKKWASIDYMIYEHFNETLWKKIAAEGPDFYDEVKQFSHIQKQVNHYCWGLDKHLHKNLEISHSQFNSDLKISRKDCESMNISWLDKIKEKFDGDNKHVVDSRPELRRQTC